MNWSNWPNWPNWSNWPNWLNWIEHQTSNLGVAGSSPVPGEFFKTRLAQLVERTTFNRVVEGSSPSSGDALYGMMCI